MKTATADELTERLAESGALPDRQEAPATSMSSSELQQRIQEAIGDDLIQVNRLLDQQLSSPHSFMGSVLQHAGSYRGKQIRPILVLLCQKAAGAESDSSAITLAAVVEMIHTATLVHDDILDEASQRRSLPTINRRWNTETGVLLGDFLFSRAFRLAASTGDALACEIIGRATDLTCAGELHQIAASQDRSGSERDYFRVIRGKTGQLFGLSCQLGARAAGATDHLQRQLQIAGLELGMAFQIADDVLDLTGLEEQTGKDTGNDLANKRLTLPLLRALQLASATEEQQIEALLAAPDATSHRELRSHAAVIQGVASASVTAEQFVKSCVRRLAQLPDSPERDLLIGIAGFAIRRQA